MENKMMTVFKTGLNGDSEYYITAEKGGKIIHPKMRLEDLVRVIVDTYPELSEKISVFYKECFASDFPLDLDISRLDPTPREELIKGISEKQIDKKKGEAALKVKEKNKSNDGKTKV